MFVSLTWYKNPKIGVAEESEVTVDTQRWSSYTTANSEYQYMEITTISNDNITSLCHAPLSALNKFLYRHWSKTSLKKVVAILAALVTVKVLMHITYRFEV